MNAIDEIRYLVKTAQLARGDIKSFYGSRSAPAARRTSTQPPAMPARTSIPNTNVKPVTNQVPAKPLQPRPSMTYDQMKRHMAQRVREYKKYIGDNPGAVSAEDQKQMAGKLSGIYKGIGSNATPEQMQKALKDFDSTMNGVYEKSYKPGEGMAHVGHGISMGPTGNERDIVEAANPHVMASRYQRNKDLYMARRRQNMKLVRQGKDVVFGDPRAYAAANKYISTPRQTAWGERRRVAYGRPSLWGRYT